MKADSGSPAAPDPRRMDPMWSLERLMPATSEATYDRLAGYGFARQFVESKNVADVCWGEIGYGSCLLAETATFVEGMAISEETVELASTYFSRSNAGYRRVELPELPYPDDHFDVVVALGVIERLEQPENLVKESKRVLKQDGVLVVSAPDKLYAVRQGRGADSPGAMHVLKLQELLGHHFGGVDLYRQGVSAGGFVLPISGEPAEVSVESSQLSLTEFSFDTEPPVSRSIIAVCSDAEVSRKGRPYLVLDRDRRVFDECEDRAEDIELLRREIQRMQETEVQAFRDALKLYKSEIAYLRAQIRKLKARLRDMENSTVWRMFEPYRRLRSKMNTWKKSGT